MVSAKKSEYLIIGISLLAALVFWVTDAVVDYAGHREGAFVDMLMFNFRDVSFRFLASLFIVTGGVFFARFFARQKRIEEQLRKTEEYLQTIIESEPECVKLIARDGTLIHMNRAGLDMIEAGSIEQVKGLPVGSLIVPEYRVSFASLTARNFDGHPGTMEFEATGLRGRRIWLETHAVPLRDGKGEIIASLGITRNITGRRQAEARIMSALREKEVLLKEVHHRVKNNLQVVAIILGLQAAQIRDDEARRYFEESQRRVEAMSLIHERLYRAEDLARIDFREYVEDLVSVIVALESGRAGEVEVSVDIQGMTLDINRAIPCGLIINELVSNVFKHAFRDGRKGTLRISMAPSASGRIFLGVADNGTGFSDGIDFRNTRSLGLQLVMALVQQLDGTIELERAAGTFFRIDFRGTAAGEA